MQTYSTDTDFDLVALCLRLRIELHKRYFIGPCRLSIPPINNATINCLQVVLYIWKVESPNLPRAHDQKFA